MKLALTDNTKIKFSGHALQRMFARGFQKSMVVEAVKTGDIIKDYPEDYPYPSYLLLAKVKGEVIHIVSAFNTILDEIYIITVYRPDKKLWSDDFKTRRK